jgi:hypothetical protein
MMLLERVLISLLVLALPTLAHAAEPEPERFALAWVRATGAEACPSSPELGHLVEATVGAALVPPTQATMLIDGLVAPKPAGGFQALIRVNTAKGERLGERRLESDDARCAEVTRSTLLVLAVMINPEAAEQGLPRGVLDALEHWDEAAATDAKSEPLAAQNPQPELPTRPRPRARVAARDTADERHPAVPEREPRSVDGIVLSGSLALNAELTPVLSFGGVATLALPLGDAWLARIEAAFFPGGSAYINSPYATGDLKFTVVELAPEICPRPLKFGRLHTSGCAGLAAGIRILDGTGLAEPAKPAQPYVGPVATLDAAWFFAKHAFIDARLHVEWLPRDDRFVFLDRDSMPQELWDPAPFAGYAALGAGGVF